MAYEYNGKYYYDAHAHIEEDPIAAADPLVFCEAFLTIPDGEDGMQPFRFDKPDKGEYRKYLFDIYRETHNRVVVVTGRQVEKSTMARNKILADMNTNEALTALYSAPRAEQVSRFSAERVDNAMRDSQGQVLKDSLLKKGKATASFKQFDSKCNLYLYSCWAEGDAIRGIAAQRVYLDEVQDVTTNARETVSECLGHAKGGGQMYHFGTPKNSGSEFHRLWDLSDKKEWFLPCDSCGLEQKMTVNNIYKEDDNKPGYFGCRKCKKELKRDTGRWLAENPQEKPHYSGYHITQLMCSWITADQILYKRATYSDQKFKNEVLGEFHNIFGKTLDLQNIMDCTDSERKLDDKGHPGPNYMGVDWGSGNNSFSVITIIGPEEVEDEFGKKEIKLVYRFVKKYAASGYGAVMKDMHKLHDAYNCQNMVIDIGDARRQFKELLVEYPNTVSACQYVLALKNPYRWDKKTRIHTVDRSYHIEKVIDLFHKKNIIIPYDNFTIKVTDRLMWLFEHLTSLEAEFVEPSSGNTGYTRYLHSNPDDGFQSLVYAWMAYEKRKVKPKSHVKIREMNWGSLFN
jgi:hypothetical protein